MNEQGGAMRWVWWTAPVLPVLLALYYGIGGGAINVVDADPEYGPGAVAPQQSRAVAVAARVVLREVDEHEWVANDPFFKPGWALDDMPAFQTGITGAVGRFANRLAELSLGTGERDIELGRAADFLKYPTNVWKFDPRTAWIPTASTEKQYRSAARNLVLFNERLLAADAQYPRDAATLAALLDGLGADMDASVARLDAHMAEGRWVLLDGSADDVFFHAKGRAYAQSLILRELGWDFAQVLSQADLGGEWQAMLAALRQAAALSPLVVTAGGEDSALFANHLANHGFRLLQARAKVAGLATALRDAAEH